MPSEADMPKPPPKGATGAPSLPVPVGPIPDAGIDLGILQVHGRAYQVKAFPPNEDNPISHADRPVFFLRGVRGALHGTMRNVPNPDRMFCMSGGRSLATLAWLTDAGGVLRVIA